MEGWARMATSEIRDDELATTDVPAVVVTTPVDDAVTATLGALLVGGSLTDAWAHTNIINEIESFFTPWHAMLYAGFTATAAWTFWLAYRRRGGTRRWWREAWPAGYAVGALGVLLFLLAGVGDMVWHTVFGIESGLDTAYSPSHILLVIGGMLLLTSPARSWWATGSDPRRAGSGIVSLALGTVFATILLGHASALLSVAPAHLYDSSDDSPGSRLEAAYGLSKYLVSTVVIAIPVLMAYRRRATFGPATAVVGALSLFAMTQFEFPAALSAAALAATVGAVIADLIVVRLDAVRGRDASLRLPIAGALLAALVWSGHLLGLHLASGIKWPVELWTGNLVFTALLGALLGGLATGSPPRTAVPMS
jgi:hypothetical protein